MKYKVSNSRDMISIIKMHLLYDTIKPLKISIKSIKLGKEFLN